MNDDLKYQIGIGLIPGIGDVIAKKLISYCGGAEAVFKEKKQALLKIPGIGDALADAVLSQNILKRAEKEVEYVKKHKIKHAYYLDENYPQRLKNCPDSPVVIYWLGEANFNSAKLISIVGTRHATAYGKELCNNLVKELNKRQHHPVIVSGLAYGIDICAHRAAIRNELPTVAVLAHGLSQVYPAEHAGTAREIVERGGALVTEFPSNTPIDRSNFVRRNRIIAGLADLTVVVESGIKGGALITADIANSYNRDVFAFPGRVTDACSLGCHWLIRTNRAALLQSLDDIEYIMNWNADKEPPQSRQMNLFDPISPREEAVVNYLREKGEASVDNMSFELQMPVSEMSTMLLGLELQGIVLSFPGKIYKIKQNG